MNLITYEQSGAYYIQVQPVQKKKKKGLRYTLHSSTYFIPWKTKENQQVNFTTTKLRTK